MIYILICLIFMTVTNNDGYDHEKEGIIDSDGEVLAWGKRTYKCEQKALMAYDKLQITVDQGLATLFTPAT
ncbi:Sphingosine kinase 2 [Spatholobus suberectus]|nr:Sphingosine kinase 2 [Spatholobus suberectus]